jgi:hypothetical protein
MADCPALDNKPGGGAHSISCLLHRPENRNRFRQARCGPQGAELAVAPDEIAEQCRHRRCDDILWNADAD